MQKEELVKRYEQGESLPQLARAFETSIYSVRKLIIQSGIMRSRKNAIAIAGKQGRMARTEKRKPFSEEHKLALKNAAIKNANASAKGVSKKPSGYVEATRGPNKGRGIHRILMETHLQRMLQKGECIHHIDENKQNNAIENLVIMTRSEHAQLHALNAASKRERDENGKFT